MGRMKLYAPDLAGFGILSTILVCIMLATTMVSANQGLILLAPLLALIGISALFFWRLARIDGRLPIADIGSLYILAILAYGAIPLLWHLLSGMQLTALSHGRLYALDPPPIEFASVGWMHVAFMATFAFAYTSFRMANPFLEGRTLSVSRNTLKVLVALLLMFEGYFLYLKIFAGINFSAAYDSSLYEHAAAYEQLSSTQQQFVAHPLGMLSAIKIGLIIWLTSKWKSRIHRWGLFAVLVYILWGYLQAPGGRFAIISILLAVMLTYHQLVQPIRFRKAILYGFLLLVAFFAANMYRGQDAGDVELIFDVLKEAAGGSSGLFSFANEFQISYGSILELQHLIESNSLGIIPWQVYFQNILLLVPSQLLPFDKIDPVVWYTKATNNPDFFNYGVIAESTIGFGLIEVIVFGLVMGTILAAIHNWYVRHYENFWPFFLYTWLAIVVYQSFRNVSMYVAPLFVFQWLPVYLLASLLVWALPKRSSAHRSSGLGRDLSSHRHEIAKTRE